MTKEGYQPLQRELSGNPVALREMFKALHTGEGELDDSFIDCVLGLPPLGNKLEGVGTNMNSQWDQTSDDIFYGSDISDGKIVKGAYAHQTNGRWEKVVYQSTGYDVIRELLRFIKPQPSDVVYDLGSGYGRFCLYGALTTGATYKGIEIAPHRLQVAERVKKKFKINNTSFILGNVVEQDISDGTIFYLYNPFSKTTTRHVLRKLRQVASTKPITVISLVTWNRPSRAPGWLKPIYVSSKHRSLQVYRSEVPAPSEH